jgi:hypothetical protein
MNGIMLPGSVPSPPRNARSSTSTQTIRLIIPKPISAGRISRVRPVTNTPPVTASAITKNRLTANP